MQDGHSSADNIEEPLGPPASNEQETTPQVQLPSNNPPVSPQGQVLLDSDQHSTCNLGNPAWFSEVGMHNELDTNVSVSTGSEVSGDDSVSTGTEALGGGLDANTSVSSAPEFDNDSDCDSLMPRKRCGYDECSVATTDMLSLCSASTGLLWSAASASTDSAGTWNFVAADDDSSCGSWAADNASQDSSVAISDISADMSISSLPTVIHTTPTITTPSAETMEAVWQATIGKKAVRADDAAVPVSLWNMTISTTCPVEDCARAFKGFREFGRRVFLRAVSTDCRDILREEFGPDWTTAPREQNGKLTKLGWRLRGIRNLI